LSESSFFASLTLARGKNKERTKLRKAFSFCVSVFWIQTSFSS
jgi:hypothetical protein